MYLITDDLINECNQYVQQAANHFLKTICRIYEKYLSVYEIITLGVDIMPYACWILKMNYDFTGQESNH